MSQAQATTHCTECASMRAQLKEFQAEVCSGVEVHFFTHMLLQIGMKSSDWERWYQWRRWKEKDIADNRYMLSYFVWL